MKASELVGSGFSRTVMSVVAASIVLTSAAGYAAPPFDIEVVSRRIAPGELVVMTMTFGVAPSNVRLTVFKKTIPAFNMPDGRWRALVGIDLDQQPGRYVAMIEADQAGTTVRQSRPIDVAPRKFPTRTLRVDPDFVNPPPDQLARIAREATFLRETYASSAHDRLWSAGFVRPVPGTANSAFGTRSIFNGQRRSPHGGADFLSPAGTPIKAPNAGRVVCARDLFFTGNTVIVDHGLGTFSMLAHLSELDVQEGETVRAGQIVGLVGATGRVTGPHLHWAVNVRGARVDPLSVLALLGQ